jgi:hypothetical protein
MLPSGISVVLPTDSPVITVFHRIFGRNCYGARPRSHYESSPRGGLSYRPKEFILFTAEGLDVAMGSLTFSPPD